MGIISDNFNNLSPIYQMLISFLDVFIVAIIIYAILYIVKNNVKTLRIFKGTIIVIFIDFIAKFFHFTALQSITQNLINWGFLVFIIIFQPEIRNFLEKIGKSGFGKHSLVSLHLSDEMIDEITSAMIDLAANKTGAIITIERDISLKDFIDTGVKIDGVISKELIKTIFKTNTPLHDGAVIIQGDRIACASTYFPPPSIEVLQSFGARHRAAIGISEITDSLTIVVSEETGRIRLVEYGNATIVDPSDFKKEFVNMLTASINQQEMQEVSNG
ncbi:diadenylate cyclase CdaA [Mycoplasma sp. P36-A1]|uniref:diadenylate cyclase CdaA n=1 Tax=Mycoplasma sp. P36-A1 TaxID=3252900 RepID=UPI003C2D1C94